MITVYGIKNCDTVIKARRWLERNRIEYAFHDFREDGLSAEQVSAWLDALGWESLVNRRSTSWKQLDQGVRDSMDTEGARTAILEQPTLIKRPLLDTGREIHVGFAEDRYRELFHQHTL